MSFTKGQLVGFGFASTKEKTSRGPCQDQNHRTPVELNVERQALKQLGGEVEIPCGMLGLCGR